MEHFLKVAGTPDGPKQASVPGKGSIIQATRPGSSEGTAPHTPLPSALKILGLPDP